MKKFIVPVSWTMYTELEIEATTIEEAITLAYEANLPSDGGSYVDDSFEVNTDIVGMLNER